MMRHLARHFSERLDASEALSKNDELAAHDEALR